MKILRRIWNVVRWPLAVLAVAFVVLVAWRTHVLYDKEDTAEAVAKIHANRLVPGDITGDLPPAPDQAANDATLAGVDSNQNGIRDDVERSIYLKYKSTPKVVVGMLQYAKALQMEFTHVYNSETLVAVMQEQSRGFSCAYGYEEEVQELVANTEARANFREEIREKYMVSYTLPNEEDCDIGI